jgi:hypothetical protein
MMPVTVTQLPVTRGQICHRTVAYRPGTLTEVLTGQGELGGPCHVRGGEARAGSGAVRLFDH